MKVLLAILIFVLAVLGTGLALIYSGVYNIAATGEHHPLVTWVLDTTMVHSVRQRAGEFQVPDLNAPERLRVGFQHFQKTCVMCHGAPGVARGVVGEGLLPRPPALNHAAREWSPTELFWILKHGIRLSGMPAFGSRHDEDTLWSLVAFVNELPNITADEYRELQQRAGERDALHNHRHAPRRFRIPAGTDVSRIAARLP